MTERPHFQRRGLPRVTAETARLLLRRLLTAASVTIVTSATLTVTWADDAKKPAASTEDLIVIGERIYREGMLSSGQPLTGELSGNIKLSGQEAACMKCHRRSGLGSSEGGKVVPSIIGRDLYQPLAARGIKLYGDQKPKTALRGAYTDETLAKSLRNGSDPTGEAFAAPMPRFALGDSDMAALTAYLKSLNGAPSPGVDDKTIHLATIVSEAVPAERRKAMLDILQAFIQDWNADIRKQSERGKFALDAMYESYRHLELQVWELKGPRGTWLSQMNNYYAAQPVFAVLSGMVQRSWQPIHDFCQHQELPCLFPITDQPAVDEQNYPVIYFSKGPAAEAEVLAKYLDEQKVKSDSRIVQVFRGDDTGSETASAFRKALEAHGFKKVRDRGLHPEHKIPPAFWTGLMEQEQPEVLALWLEPADLVSLKDQPADSKSLRSVFLSGSLHHGATPAIPDAVSRKLYVLYPYELPEKRGASLARMKAWLKMKKLPVTDDLDQARAYFGILSVAETLKHMVGNYSRDYLIERLEAMSNPPIPSGYPHLSLGPDQRFSAKGCYVARLTAPGELQAVSGWLTP